MCQIKFAAFLLFYCNHNAGNIEWHNLNYLHVSYISYMENYLLIEDFEKLTLKCCCYSVRKSDLIYSLLLGACSIASDSLPLCLSPVLGEELESKCPLAP